MALLVVLPACIGPEPDFQSSELTEVPESAAFRAEDDGPPDLETLRAAGLEGTLSEGRPPPPFVPDEAHYPPVPPRRSLEDALRRGTPRLLYALRVEERAGETVVTALEEGAGVEAIRVVLPESYQCHARGVVLAGRRYILITRAADEHGRYPLHLGLGAEHSIMPVDDAGAVDTPDGTRDAAVLIAEARRAS